MRRSGLTWCWMAMASARRGAVRAAMSGLLLLGACRPAEPEARTAIPGYDPALFERPVAGAIASARAAATATPTAATWGRYAMVLHAHELHGQAADAYARAAELEPRNHRWAYLAAVALRGIDPDQAFQRIEAAVRLAPSAAHVRRAHGDALADAGRDEDAAAAYEAALALKADDRGSMLGLAELCLRRGDLDGAESLLRRAVEIHFADRTVHEKLARLHRMRGDDRRATREAQIAAANPHPAPSFDPDRAEVDAQAVGSQAQTRRGLNLARRGDYPGALREFTAAAGVRPEDPEIQANFAMALAALGRTDEALRRFRAAVDAAPDRLDTRVSFATALMNAGRVEEAAREVSAILAVDPRSWQALFLRGALLERSGRTADAIAAYEQALAVNPADAQALNNLALLSAGAGRMEQARQYWTAAIECGISTPEATYNLALSWYLELDFARAEQALKEGLARRPEEPMFLAALAAIRATSADPALRDAREATQLALRVRRHCGDAHAGALDLLAAARAAAGDFGAATSDAERAADLARAAGDTALAGQIDERLARYRRGEPIVSAAEYLYLPPVLAPSPFRVVAP